MYMRSIFFGTLQLSDQQSSGVSYAQCAVQDLVKRQIYMKQAGLIIQYSILGSLITTVRAGKPFLRWQEGFTSKAVVVSNINSTLVSGLDLCLLRILIRGVLLSAGREAFRQSWRNFLKDMESQENQKNYRTNGWPRQYFHLIKACSSYVIIDIFLR